MRDLNQIVTQNINCCVAHLPSIPALHNIDCLLIYLPKKSETEMCIGKFIIDEIIVEQLPAINAAVRSPHSLSHTFALRRLRR